jgi:hypothetical protein
MRPFAPMLVATLLAGCGGQVVGTIDFEIRPDSPRTGDDVRVRAIVRQWVDDFNLTATVGERTLTFTRADATEDMDPVAGRVYTVVLPAAETTRDDVWTLTATADVGRNILQGTTSLTIANTPPEGTVALSPEAPRRVDTLVANAAFTDADGDAFTLSYTWYVNNQPTGHTGPELPPGVVRRSDRVRVEVVANDGTDDSPVAKAEADVRNSPPSVTLTLSPEEPYTIHDLVALAAGVDADGDDLSMEYSWEINGEQLTTTADILPRHLHKRGDRVRARAVARDGRTLSEPAWAEVTILNTPPGAPAIAISPSGPTVEADITCQIVTPAEDADRDTLTYEFAWFRNGADWTGPTARTVHAGDTILAAYTALDDVWRCSAFAFDGEDDGPSVSAEATVVAWSGPRTFTNCSKTGHEGPSQSQCDTAYRSTTLADDGVVVTAGVQEWVVPASGRYRITAYGAQGKSADSVWVGGKGAEISGVFDLRVGESLFIAVGQEGTMNSCNGGGGGGSWVMDKDKKPLIVAGGGGGTRQSVSQNGCGGRTTDYGGTASGAGTTWSCAAKTTGLRQGGIISSSSWGSAGAGIDSNGAGEYTADNGGKSWANGLRGGGNTSYPAYGGFGGGGSGAGGCGGGGGGGYSGGDGGRLAGGGGSFNAGASKADKADSQTGHGKVVIDVE